MAPLTPSQIFETLEKFWLLSPYRTRLDEIMNKHILSRPQLSLDSALCLGLGPLQRTLSMFSPYIPPDEKWAKELLSLPKYVNARPNLIWYEYDSLRAATSSAKEVPKGEMQEENDWPDIYGFYQLFLFEKIIEYLRTKFTIKETIFQDPAFDSFDIEFLESRGHIVIPYPKKGESGYREPKNQRTPLDLNILPHISSGTFFFGPNLHPEVTNAVMATAKPRLFLGHDFCIHIADSIFESDDVKEEFLSAIRDRYSFTPAGLGDDFNFCVGLNGFQFPANTSDTGEMSEIRKRIEMAEKRIEMAKNLSAKR